MTLSRVYVGVSVMTVVYVKNVNPTNFSTPVQELLTAQYGTVPYHRLPESYDWRKIFIC